MTTMEAILLPAQGKRSILMNQSRAPFGRGLPRVSSGQVGVATISRNDVRVDSLMPYRQEYADDRGASFFV
jgi:hypothetical protein